MNKKVFKILNMLGLKKIFFAVLILRAPFDFLNAVITANMLERFIRLTELGKKDDLECAFWFFFVISILLFTYNCAIWSTLSVRYSVSFQKGLRKKLLSEILSFDQSTIDRLSTGNLVTILNNDTDKVNNYIGAPLNMIHLTVALVNVVFSSVILIYLDLSLYLIAIGVMLPFMFISTAVISGRIPEYKRSAQLCFGKYTDLVKTAADCEPVLKVYDGRKLLETKAEEVSKNMMKQNMKAHNRIAWTFFFNTFSGNLGYLLLLFVGSGMIGSKLTGFAKLSKITQYRGNMMQSMMVTTSSINNMKTNLIGVERVNEILERKGDTENE